MISKWEKSFEPKWRRDSIKQVCKVYDSTGRLLVVYNIHKPPKEKGSEPGKLDPGIQPPKQPQSEIAKAFCVPPPAVKSAIKISRRSCKVRAKKKIGRNATAIKKRKMR